MSFTAGAIRHDSSGQGGFTTVGKFIALAVLMCLYGCNVLKSSHHFPAPNEVVLNLLPASASLGPDGDVVTLVGFVTTSTGEPIAGIPVVFASSGSINLNGPIIAVTDKFGQAKLKLEPRRDTRVCFFLSSFAREGVRCSGYNTPRIREARSLLTVERPRIDKILPIKVKYKLGTYYYITLIGAGFAKNVQAWLTDTPATVVVTGRNRIVISFPAPATVENISAGGEEIFILNPTSGYSTKKKGFNFSDYESP